MGLFDFLRRSEPQKKAHKLQTRRYRAPLDKTSPGGWLPAGGSVERAPGALPLIRSRARDLAHNNPYAARAVSVLTSHTVGSGIRFSVRGDEAYEEAFRAWAGSTDCDYEGRLNLYGIQAVACRTMFEAGDAFVIIRQARTAAGLRPTLQLLDPDQLDDSASPRGGRENKVIAGVEVDRGGRIVGYHVRADLELGNSKAEFVRASDMIHLFEQLHPGQVRGIPRGAQALIKANTVDSFLAAALAKARTEACFVAFVTGPSLDDGAGIIGEIDESSDEYTLPEMLEPGTIVPLPDGHDVKIAVPSGSGGLRDYVEIGLQAVAVSYGVTYAQLSGDVSKANFSSEKASRLEFYRGVDTVRAHFVMPALSRVEAAFRVAYEASEGRDVEARVSMTAPGRESIEPAKDALAEMTVEADIQPLVEPPEPEILQYSVDGGSLKTTGELRVSVSYTSYDPETQDFGVVFTSLKSTRGDLWQPYLAVNSQLFSPVITASVARADARLRAAARCVDVSVDLSFEKAMALDTSSVVRLTDDRLPGGSATGKVTSVELYADGDGSCFGSVNFGCSVGRAAVLATPTATVDPYAVPGEPGIVSHCRLSGAADDGSLAISKSALKNSLQQQAVEIQNMDLTMTANRFAGMGYRWAQQMDDAAARQAIEERLAEIPTELSMELVSLEPIDETLREVTAAPSGPVQIFRGINLEA